MDVGNGVGDCVGVIVGLVGLGSGVVVGVGVVVTVNELLVPE